MCQCRFEMPGTCPGEGNCPMAAPDMQDAIDEAMVGMTDEDMADIVDSELTHDEEASFYDALAELMSNGPNMSDAKAIYHALADAVERKAIERILK